jgi:hypothetical protein
VVRHFRGRRPRSGVRFALGESPDAMKVKTFVAGQCVIGKTGERAPLVGAARAGSTLNPSGIAGLLSAGSLALICAEQPRQRGRFQSSSAPRVPLGPLRQQRELERQRMVTQNYAKRLRAGSAPALVCQSEKSLVRAQPGSQLLQLLLGRPLGLDGLLRQNFGGLDACEALQAANGRAEVLRGEVGVPHATVRPAGAASPPAVATVGRGPDAPGPAGPPREVVA